ncbi:reverse transcriptase domain-containing protein [Hyphococcus formosus]|uniref:reverse transcriptase domain-containing protein n=1 Tax=Hyphococcus formosus TaxID=3143534 RepID=UPI00398AB127
MNNNNLSFSKKDVKNYPHFDAPISLNNIEALVTDRRRVAENSFYPFLLYYETWQPYRTKIAEGDKPNKKTRPIRYAARRDAYILAYYRRELSDRYEKKLETMGLSDCPIAYRKIQNEWGQGKCNIDFAKEAFDAIDTMGNCVAIALDIQSYFESLDHRKIKSLWCELLGVSSLPPDHYAIFKYITKYHYCDQKEVYRRLGYITKNEQGQEEYKVSYRDMPKQICSPDDFRRKICGRDSQYPSLIQKNWKNYGIPQGSPISDLIANFYLIHFDKAMSELANQVSGIYMRYSDDILFLAPNEPDKIEEILDFTRKEITKHGDQLKIKDKKTCVVEFKQCSTGLTYKHKKGPHGARGFEYLGFRYDGKNVYIREATISRLYRKVSIAAKREAKRQLVLQPTADPKTILGKIDFHLLYERFTKVRRTKLTSDYRTWTFYTYAKRARSIFGQKGKRIIPQISNMKKIMHDRTERAINKGLQKRKEPTG